MEEGKNRDQNQQQTQPANDTGSRICTRATVLGGEHEKIRNNLSNKSTKKSSRYIYLRWPLFRVCLVNNCV